jgi:hypothetical protein
MCPSNILYNINSKIAIDAPKNMDAEGSFEQVNYNDVCH